MGRKFQLSGTGIIPWQQGRTSIQGQALYVRSARRTARTLECPGCFASHRSEQGAAPPLLLDLSGAVDRLDKLPQRIRGKRHQGIRISYDLVGFFIPEEELLKQETA